MKSTSVKIAVVVALLLIAGLVVYFRQAGAQGQPDTPDSATAYICPADGAVLNVTPAEFERLFESGDAGPREGAAGRGAGLHVRCPTCKKRIMGMAARCPKDGTVFAPAGADGKPAACPKCGWKPEAR